MGQMNDECLDRHFTKQLQMMTDVYCSTVSKSDFLMSQRWLHVFNMASNTQDKYARNCLMLLMYSHLREMGKLGMPFIRKRNVYRPLVDVLSEFQGVQEGLDTESEPGEEAQKASFRQAEDRQQKPQPGQAQLKKKITENEVLRQSRPEPKFDTQTSENEDQMVCSFSNASSDPRACNGCILQGRRSKLKRFDDGNQGMDFHKDNTNFETVPQQDQAPKWNVNHMHACVQENQHHCRQADSSSKRRLLQVEPRIALMPPSTQLVLAQIKCDAQLAMDCLQHWKTASGPLKFFNITLQHIVEDEPETRRQLLELDGKLETLLNNMLEQEGERREKNVRILYDHLFKQQESLNCKHEMIRHEQETLNQARHQLETRMQDFKRLENNFWQQQQDYHHCHAADMPHYTTQERTSRYQYPKMPQGEQPRCATTQTDRGPIIASTYVNICRCSGDKSASATAYNGTTASGSVCSCSDCQPEVESLRSISSKHSLVRICKYCAQRPFPEGGNWGMGKGSIKE